MSDTFMRAKMEVSHIVRIKNEVYNQTHLTMNAVSKYNGYPSDGSDEDNTYAKFTPIGELKIVITNPDLVDKFELAQKFYVDFTEIK